MGFSHALPAHAALTLTSGDNATTTPNVATSITGFQIVGPDASTTPVKIHVTNGIVHVATVSGVTASGNGTATLNLSGTVANLNTALSSLTYTRSSTGTDTLEVALVNSDQIYFPDNGHVYQYVGSTLTWNVADTTAQTLTAYGAKGYLVTITSANENNFVKARLSGDAWIGASDVTTEGDWKWVTGPEAGTSFWSGTGGGHTVNSQYASWATGEPNDSDSNEDCGEEYVSSGAWNDLPCTGTTVSGYVAEFGSDADPATVVSKDVSIVTADVPAVTSLTPATGATAASTSANLVIGFSKTVTGDTGTILIRKTSDDSILDSIDVAGDHVTGNGTNTITVTPNVTFPEGTQLYVTVPSTAFKDADGNYFGGISDPTTWTFTTADITPPTISDIATTTATTTATVSWTTNEAASSQLWYSPDSSYASSTSETDTGPRVTSHSIPLSNLLACSLYHYEAVSRDAAGNAATSTGATFYTTGCPGGAAPSSSVSNTVDVSAPATTTLSDTGHTLTVETPANVTATSSSIVIQIKAMAADTVLGSIGTPSTALTRAADVVFDVTALIDGETTLDSFDTPVTITYHYTDADISGLDESTLSMYHYHDDAWLPLDDCSVDAASNTITCNAPSFSTFAIFGTPVASSSSHSSHPGGTSIQGQVANLTSMGKTAAADALKAEWPSLFPQVANASAPVATTASTSISSVRDLELGMTGSDVLALQKLLNANGFSLAASGVGSAGNETDYFGTLTQAAVAAYQKANGVTPTAGYFGPLTRASMTAKDISGLWW